VHPGRHLSRGGSVAMSKTEGAMRQV